MRVTYGYIQTLTVTYRLHTNTLVTYEYIGAKYDGRRVINTKCTIFLVTLHFYMCAGHVLQTHMSMCKCHTCAGTAHMHVCHICHMCHIELNLSPFPQVRSKTV